MLVRPQSVEQASKRHVPTQGADVYWPSVKRGPEDEGCFCWAIVVRNARGDVNALVIPSRMRSL